MSNGNNGNGGGEEEEPGGVEDASSADEGKRSPLMLPNGNSEEGPAEDVFFDETNGKDGFAIRSDTKQVSMTVKLDGLGI